MLSKSLRLVTAAPLLAAFTAAPQVAHGQAAPLVDVCSGLSVDLPVLQPIVADTSSFLNVLLSPVTSVLGTLVGDINDDLVGVISGRNIGVSVLDTNGNLITTPGDCGLSTDVVSIDNTSGIAIGGGEITGLGSTAAVGAIAGNVNALAIGNGATTTTAAISALALGQSTSVTAADGIAIGRGASASAQGGIALGAGSIASRTGLAGGAELFSRNTVASTAGALSVGAAGSERQIANVAGGTAATDAVNVRQLQSVGDDLAGGLGGGASFSSTTGIFTGPSYSLRNTTFFNVGSALAALDASISTVETNISTINQSITTLGDQINNIAVGGTNLTQVNNRIDTVNTRVDTVENRVDIVEGDIIDINADITTIKTKTGAIATNNTSGLPDATATGNDALGLGYGASASGTLATAVGTGATASATGSTALGAGSTASGVASTALGTGSRATAASSTAVGQGAVAAYQGSTAIGAGARTTRTNQVAIGSTSSTYTLSGVTSSASAAAQTGPTRFLTTDAAGNIATANVDVGGLADGITSLRKETRETRTEARRGIAAAMAMSAAPTPSTAGASTWATNIAAFKGEVAGSLAFAHRFDTEYAVTFNAAAAVSPGGELGGRIGLAGEF